MNIFQEKELDNFEPIRHETLENLRSDLITNFPSIKIIEEENRDNKGQQSDTFYIEYEIDKENYIRSVVKTPKYLKGIYKSSSESLITHEFNMYKKDLKGVDGVPNLIGFNENSKILHLSFIYSHIKTQEELTKTNPLLLNLETLKSLQEIHKREIAHTDCFLDTLKNYGTIAQNLIFTKSATENLKVKIIDFGHAYKNNPSENFEEDRKQDLANILTILINHENKTKTENKDEEKISEISSKYGLSLDTSEKIYTICTYNTPINFTIEEVDDLIIEMEESLKVNFPQDILIKPTFIPKGMVTENSKFTQALDILNKVNKYLINY